MKVTFRGKPLIPSKYLEAADLMGKRVPVVIEKVHERAKMKSESGDDESKPLFRLRGKNKGWVLNTTNLDSIADVYGYEAEAWIGKTVVIYGAKINAFGERHIAIRVDIDATQARANAAPASKQDEPAHDEQTGEVADEAASDVDTDKPWDAQETAQG